MTPFDYVNIIFKKNKEDISNYKDYIPFIVNRALSSHQDCIFYANEMNLYNSLDNDIQCEYLINSIRKKHRKFIPWVKNKVKDDSKIIMEYFDVGFDKSLEIIEILTKEQIDEVKKVMSEGYSR